MLCARYSYKTDLRVKAQEAYERGEKAGMETGFAAGKKDQTIAIAKELINSQIPISIISKSTGLSEEEISELRMKN